MTKVGQLFEEEKQRYAKEYAGEQALKIAIRLYKEGMSLEKISEITLMSVEEIKEMIKNQ